jgi:hypothetical protein
LSAAFTAIVFPVAVDPVKKTPLTPGCSTIAAPTSPSPCTTLITPSGRPASAKNSPTIAQAVAANSEGFHTTVLPAATMCASAIEAMSVGKLYGVIAPTTPSGRCVSTRRLLFVCSWVGREREATVPEHLFAGLVPGGRRVLVHLFARLRDRLADLLHEHARDRLGPLDEERVDPPKDLHPIDQRGRRPAGLGGRRSGHGSVDVGDATPPRRAAGRTSSRGGAYHRYR